MDAETRYRQLGALLASPPPLSQPLLPEALQWLARCYAHVHAGSDAFDIVEFKQAIETLQTPGWKTLHAGAATKVRVILQRTFALAEMAAPAASQGAFIPAGNVFDAMIEFGKIARETNISLLLVDPYLDERGLEEFAVQAPEITGVRLLADAYNTKPSLKPACERWVKQYGARRPLECRLAPARSLHDRLIFIDGKKVWLMTQSLNALAARAPASIIRADEELAKLKIAAYEAMWNEAKPI